MRILTILFTALLLFAGLLVITEKTLAQDNVRAAPDRALDEGVGPFSRMVIRGGTLIDGTGAPPIGPVDIVVENNIITEVRVVGSYKQPIDEEGRPEKGDHEIDATGMYIMPGFINSHAHISNTSQFNFGEASPAEYAYKLWMAHGITTIRVVGGNTREWTFNERARSEANNITAPRIVSYIAFPENLNPEEAQKWVQDLAKEGGEGIKFFGSAPDVMKAALGEAQKRGLKTAMHHAQTRVTRWNVMDSARSGLDSMEHWYGLPEALFTDRTVQDYPANYNYTNEQDRFGQAGRLWGQAAKPGSERWNSVVDELISYDFTLSPTLTIYEASRDIMAARSQEWLPEHTWPALWGFFQASRSSHGSYWFDWTTADEIAWKNNFSIWMRFINDYKNKGGRVTLGDDAGFIYKLYGFGYIREFELLQEAGFHPLEVVRAATLNGAELIGRDHDLGTIEKGKLADIILIDENPLQNFKVLYATGAMRLNDETDQQEMVGGIKWTIKDGIVYDAKKLIQDVRDMVQKEQKKNDATG
jgi:hypothetical protein